LRITHRSELNVSKCSCFSATVQTTVFANDYAIRNYVTLLSQEYIYILVYCNSKNNFLEIVLILSLN